jgi:hypothetical protein
MGRGRLSCEVSNAPQKVWYTHSNYLSERANISEEAFQDAVATFAADLKLNSGKISFASEAISLKDMVDTVRHARSRFQSSKGTKARKWLNRFSGCVVYYSTIFDVLVQQHPEYVSLAWGAMKFLFVVRCVQHRYNPEPSYSWITVCGQP